MKPILRYLLFFALVAIALFAIGEISDNASAADATWARTGGNALASLAGNWQNGSAPTTGDNVYFTSLSVLACTWDTTATVNYISIGAGYTGATAIVTCSSDMNIGNGGLKVAGGTFTGVTTKIITSSGPVTNTGTWSAGVSYLHITESVSLTFKTNDALYGLWIDSEKTVSLVVTGQITVVKYDVRGVYQIPAGAKSIWTSYSGGASYANTGTIQGAGTLEFRQYNVETTFPAIGTVNCPVIVGGLHASDRIATMSANWVLGSTLVIQNIFASNTMTIQLAGYSISCTALTVGVKGNLIGSGAVSCSSNFDSYNGTTSGSWSLTMTGASSPWIKTPAANTINGLTWTGTNLRLASSLNITKTFWVGGTYTLGTKTLTVGTATNVTITLGNSWTVTATRYWGALNVTGTLTAAIPVSVWANSTCSVNGTVASTITLHVKQMTTFNGAVGNLYIEAAYRMHFYANGTWTAIYWNTTTTWNFHPEGLMPYNSPVYSKAQMRVIDPTNNAYYIEVTRFDTNVGFSIMVHGWAAETWEFTVTSTSATATLFTYNIVTPDVETEPVLIYLNGVYLDAKNMTLGSFTMNDVFNSTMGTRDYLIVCSDFGPTTPITTFDYGIMGMCLVILSILTFASFRFQPLFIINGFVWITVAMLIIEPVQATIALLCLGVGLIFAMWGAYRALLG